MTREDKAKRFFAAQALTHARGLSMAEAETFLKGLCLVCGQASEIDLLRQAHDDVRALNQQMEQLQFTLDLK